MLVQGHSQNRACRGLKLRLRNLFFCFFPIVKKQPGVEICLSNYVLRIFFSTCPVVSKLKQVEKVERFWANSLLSSCFRLFNLFTPKVVQPSRKTIFSLRPCSRLMFYNSLSLLSICKCQVVYRVLSVTAAVEYNTPCSRKSGPPTIFLIT